MKTGVRIARIVKSNSHVDYVARVIDALDTGDAPAEGDYGFARFVSIPLTDIDVIGVVYNSELVNPEYGSFGPRLSPRADLAVLSPDYLSEQGILLGIILLGWLDRRTMTYRQAIPSRIIPVNQDVFTMDDDEMCAFHRSESEKVQLHYYSQVITHTKMFGVALLEAIIEQMETRMGPEEKTRLAVLRKALVWQRTIGGLRL